MTPIVTPTPTPASLPPPPPAPEPEEPEEIGECAAPGPDDEPVEPESDGDCPCEGRFGTMDAKLDSIARQLDELKALQAQMLHK